MPIGPGHVRGNQEGAVAHFERALELAPESKVVLLDYALRLPKLDGKKGRERARELLKKAVGLPVGDVYGGFVHERAVAELKGLEGGVVPYCHFVCTCG